MARIRKASREVHLSKEIELAAEAGLGDNHVKPNS